jgi:hypothetical protein
VTPVPIVNSCLPGPSLRSLPFLRFLTIAFEFGGTVTTPLSRRGGDDETLLQRAAELPSAVAADNWNSWLANFA